MQVIRAGEGFCGRAAWAGVESGAGPSRREEEAEPGWRTVQAAAQPAGWIGQGRRALRRDPGWSGSWGGGGCLGHSDLPPGFLLSCAGWVPAGVWSPGDKAPPCCDDVFVETQFTGRTARLPRVRRSAVVVRFLCCAVVPTI